MRVNMAIVGVPNVTITSVHTEAEVEEMELHNAEAKKQRPLERLAFDNARRRYAQQGATEVRYFAA